MTRDEKHSEIMSAAEALLFVSDEPVSAARLSEILQVSPVEVDQALVMLSAEYMDENRGMQLREVAGGWRFYTHPAHHDIIERYVISWDTHRMSQAALEALAVIAYHQPVTRAGVNAIRGVNSESVVSSLIEKGLVREMGRDKPGGSILYGTTRAFLERFGLKSAKDLPPLEDFAPDEESRNQIRERLSGSTKLTESMQLELTDEEPQVDEDGLESFDATQEEDRIIAVEEVDRGDDERIDDPDEMAGIISVAATQKVPSYFDDEDEDDDEDDEPYSYFEDEHRSEGHEDDEDASQADRGADDDDILTIE